MLLKVKLVKVDWKIFFQLKEMLVVVLKGKKVYLRQFLLRRKEGKLVRLRKKGNNEFFYILVFLVF